ncbi:cytochrome P450 [Stachybotrys elegans]|uniref:Cytochrome P450 n=1 Tax=Stachybotrys elegans TaxID=80388 RepID=A0A8K0WT83_9HYPO|nr:cytochrome P450 [Stachybotrys elegans]
MTALLRVESAAKYSVAILLPLALFTATYRLAFHPLRTYPGPFIAKLTDAYGGYQVKRKRLHLQAHSDLSKYGPVYRQGPNRLVFNTVAALRDISRHPSIRKSHVYSFTSFTPTPHVLGTVDPEPHRMKRNVYGRALSGHVYMAWPAIRALNRIVMLFNMPKLLTGARLLKNIIKRRAAMEESSGRHDFWAVASTSHQEHDLTTPNSIEKSHVWAEALFFFPAGGQTTSCALSAAFFYLSRHPFVYARLAAEVRDVFSDGSLIQGGPQLLSCKYLRAVIDETLRMSPPTTVMPWREVDRHLSSKEPCVIDGHVVPGGTLVAISAYCLMHNKAYFPEPFAFRPERWLDDTDPDRLARMAEAFIPFSVGDTMCLGKTMAYMEMSLVLAKTLWYFDFKQAPGEAGKLGGGNPEGWDGALRGRVDEFQLYDAFVGQHNGPNLTFIPRKEL